MAATGTRWSNFLKQLRNNVISYDRLRVVKEELEEIEKEIDKKHHEEMIDNMVLGMVYFTVNDYEYDKDKIVCSQEIITLKLVNRGVRCDDVNTCNGFLMPDELQDYEDLFKKELKKHEMEFPYAPTWLKYARSLGDIQHIYDHYDTLIKKHDKAWKSVGDWDDPEHEALLNITVKVYYPKLTTSDFSADHIFKIDDLETGEDYWITFIDNKDPEKQQILHCDKSGHVFDEEDLGTDNVNFLTERKDLNGIIVLYERFVGDEKESTNKIQRTE